MSDRTFATIVAAVLVVVAAASRVIPHPWNFTPMIAVALFGGARISRSWLAIVGVLGCLALGDIAIGVFPYEGMSSVYVSMLLVVLLGRVLRSRTSILATLVTALGAGAMFFVITNFAVFAGPSLPAYARGPRRVLRRGSAVLSQPDRRGPRVFGRTVRHPRVRVVAAPRGARVRIASLLASATELVCDLGAGDELVARSHECNHPAWVTRLPSASRPTFDITGSSKQIDALVRERLAAGQPLYVVDEALLLSLKPDVIITQTHCEVCAVSPANVGASCAANRSRRCRREHSLASSTAFARSPR